jgi:hypothetical protein
MITRANPVTGKAIAPATVAASSTPNRFGPQTGVAQNDFYLDSGNAASIIHAQTWVAGSPINLGSIQFTSSGAIYDTEVASTTFEWRINGSSKATLSTTALAVTGGVTATTAITSSGATSGLGYATGAGGTVTQSTNKSTGVTLNKVCGEITMNGAALAASTTVSFVLTNSAIAAGDTIILNHVTTGTFGAYTLNAHGFGAGSCTIDVRNVSLGSLSEAIVIRYAVIKAVTA